MKWKYLIKSGINTASVYPAGLFIKHVRIKRTTPLEAFLSFLLSSEDLLHHNPNLI